MSEQKYPMQVNLKVNVGMDQVNIRLLTESYRTYVGLDETGASYCFRASQVEKEGEQGT